ncbi:hypothetical protein D3C80_1797410 [compost metagenome]
MRRGKQLHPFQLFNSALCLTCFSSLGFKTINIFLNMCPCFDLLFIGLLLLCQTFCTSGFKRRIVAAIEGKFLVFDMQNTIGNGI